jgi:putative SOS response-associated peptidase YedK
MCGRITRKSSPGKLGLGLTTVSLLEPLRFAPRFNGAPGQRQLVIRQHPTTGERSFDLLFWGLVPHWCKDPDGGRRPINAKAETVAVLPAFRDAYRQRRCLVPVDSFFEWRAVKGTAAKQPYAVSMKRGEPFALAGIWENWKRPGREEWVRTFAVITTRANDLLRPIHDRMPVIIPPIEYDRWLSSFDPDPRDLLRPFPSDPMTIWPVSTRVNKPENDYPEVLERIDTAGWRASLVGLGGVPTCDQGSGRSRLAATSNYPVRTCAARRLARDS